MLELDTMGAGRAVGSDSPETALKHQLAKVSSAPHPPAAGQWDRSCRRTFVPPMGSCCAQGHLQQEQGVSRAVLPKQGVDMEMSET